MIFKRRISFITFTTIFFCYFYTIPYIIINLFFANFIIFSSSIILNIFSFQYTLFSNKFIRMTTSLFLSFICRLSWFGCICWLSWFGCICWLSWFGCICFNYLCCSINIYWCSYYCIVSNRN